MAPQALKDCVIALSGTFHSSHSALSSDIKSLGAKHSNKFNTACTHLVASQDHYDTNAAKVKQALQYSDIQIVSIEWLLDSFTANARADESNYLMANANSRTKSDTQPDDDPETVDDTGVERASNEKNDKGRKRVRDSESNQSASIDSKSQGQPPAKKLRDGQKAKSSSLQVPVDEGCNLAGSYVVFIDNDGIIHDAALNQTNVGANNNKFYRIQLLKSTTGDNWHTWTRWGRVGEHGQKKMLGAGSFTDAKKEFDKKFKEKSGHKWDDRQEPPKQGKYTYIERNYEEDSSDGDELPGVTGRRASKASSKSEGGKSNKPIESNLPKPVQRLMEFIFNQNNFASAMAEMSYDANKLPLGKLSKRTLIAGFERLKELAELIDNPALADEKHNMTFDQAIAAITNSYYSTIPHAFGRNRPPMIMDEQRLKKEIELIESLSDMEIANEIMKDANKSGEGDAMHQLDRQFAGLGLTEMTPLSSTSNEYKHLDDYLVKTHGHTHYMRMQVQDIFRIERNGEFDRFSKSPYAKITNGDRRLLWHGSRSTNFGGILSQGLRIAPPEAPVNGYMFGKGVYLADISSKSANYCGASASGNVGLLLLCEAELGKPMYEPEDAGPNAAEKAKEEGCSSTWGKGMTVPKGWKDAGCILEDLKGVSMPDTTQPPGQSGYAMAFLQYNEYIVYDIAQIRLRYLLRVEMA